MTPGIIKLLKHVDDSIIILESDMIPREDNAIVQAKLIEILDYFDYVAEYIEETYE
jgi:hypothetical protein